MADQKLRELTETTTPVSTDLAYLVVDSDGTPLDRKIEIGTLLGNLGAWHNLAMNSPGQIVTDGVEPQWWDDVANATITDEDAAGEGIAEKTGRVFKVVTIADDVYGYQTLTFANESLLDAGQTVVSFSCWVYSAGANEASIGIYGTNLGLQESSQHTGGGSWELLTVENQTLDAADASIQLRLIVDTATAYFTMPMLNVGSCALPWRERGIAFRPIAWVQQLNLTTGDVGWTTTDCTANTHPLAVAIAAHLSINDAATAGSTAYISHSSDVITGGLTVIALGTIQTNANNATRNQCSYIMCNDSQVIEYTVNEGDADNDLNVSLFIHGYWRWVP